MNRKKLNPSEADLRASILTQIASCYPTVDELSKEEWVTINQMAEFMKISCDSADKRLRRKVEKGELEIKKQKCLVNGRARLVTFFRLRHETS